MTAEDANYLAQANQEGGWSEKEGRPSTPTIAPSDPATQAIKSPRSLLFRETAAAAVQVDTKQLTTTAPSTSQQLMRNSITHTHRRAVPTIYGK
ncbi:MAG: hypothetical protein R3E08_12415 [Thiotrichaceae bacterium]